MPIWEMPAVGVQPAIGLIRWTVVRFQSNDLQADFAYGWDIENSCARVSSVISTVDRGACALQTRSGRTYRLLGQACSDPEAEYVFRRNYAQLISLCAFEDVSGEYEPMATP